MVSSETPSLWCTAGVLAVCYVVLGLSWILGSDYLLGQLFADSATRSTGQHLRDLFFIAATCIILFFVLRRTNATLVASAKRTAESDLKNEDLFEHHPTPMWVYDALTNGFLAVNDAALHRYGFSEEEFLKMTLLDIRPAEDVPRFISTEDGIAGRLRS